MLDTPSETDADLELGPDDAYVGGPNWSFMFSSLTGTKPFTSFNERASAYSPNCNAHK